MSGESKNVQIVSVRMDVRFQPLRTVLEPLQGDIEFTCRCGAKHVAQHIADRQLMHNVVCPACGMIYCGKCLQPGVEKIFKRAKDRLIFGN